MNTPSLNHRIVLASRLKQRGASLLEGIAYLGIAAIVILGAVSLLTGAFSSAQSNRVSEEVISLRTGIKKLFMGQSAGYGVADLAPTLDAARVLPGTLSLVAGVINNSWGGTVTVTGANLGANFTITYTLVPQDACINLLSGASGWLNITVGAAAPITVFPITPAIATAACPVGNSVIVWTSV